MKVLVTGGCGFIGSALCRRLTAAGHAVINFDKLTYAATRGSTAMLDASPLYRLIEGDIADAAAVARLFAEQRPDAVVNLAAETHVDRSITGAGPFIQTNIVGTFVLLQAAFEHWKDLDSERWFRFLQVSTDEVYGSLGADGAFTEQTPYAPSSPYAASKAGADHLAMAWGRTFGLPVMVSNCSNNYGPFQLPEKLIPLMIISALEGRPLPVYGDGSNVRDWLFVDDHASALALILERGHPGETYNVGARAERDNLTVVRAICDLVDEMAPPLEKPRREILTFVADRPGHDARYAIDPSKLEAALSWRPDIPFEAGLRRTVAWYLENRDWWAPLTGHASRREGLIAP